MCEPLVWCKHMMIIIESTGFEARRCNPDTLSRLDLSVISLHDITILVGQPSLLRTCSLFGF